MLIGYRSENIDDECFTLIQLGRHEFYHSDRNERILHN